MQNFRRLNLACPVCGARNAIEYRYTLETKQTESRCIICRSNWIDDKRLGENGIREEYRRNVSDEYFQRRRHKPSKPSTDPDREIRTMIDRLNHIGHSINNIGD